MDLAMWLVVGAAVGWFAFSWLRFNEQRGRRVSIIIGMVAGFLGGFLIAPLITAIPIEPGHFNPVGLIVAFACAAGCLIVCSMIHDRFGV